MEAREVERKNIFCTCAAQFPMLSLKSLYFQHYFPLSHVVTCLMALVVFALLRVSN